MITDKSILVCEDDADSRELLRFAFELEGYAVTECDDLDECFEQARRGNFHAIILDNYLGSASTVEMCRRIRAGSSVPIIFYSGEARRAEIGKALEAGANAYLIKPLDFDKLIATVSELIKENF